MTRSARTTTSPAATSCVRSAPCAASHALAQRGRQSRRGVADYRRRRLKGSCRIVRHHLANFWRGRSTSDARRGLQCETRSPRRTSRPTLEPEGRCPGRGGEIPPGSLGRATDSRNASVRINGLIQRDLAVTTAQHRPAPFVIALLKNKAQLFVERHARRSAGHRLLHGDKAAQTPMISTADAWRWRQGARVCAPARTKWWTQPGCIYTTFESKMSSSAPAWAKFPMSPAVAWPSAEARPRCSASSESKLSIATM